MKTILSAAFWFSVYLAAGAAGKNEFTERQG